MGNYKKRKKKYIHSALRIASRLALAVLKARESVGILQKKKRELFSGRVKKNNKIGFVFLPFVLRCVWIWVFGG